MADDVLRTIIPPSGPPYSPDALNAALALLSPEQQAVLDLDRARQTQAMAAAAIMFCQSLDLSPPAGEEVASAVVDKLSQASPEWQGFIAQCLANAAIAVRTTRSVITPRDELRVLPSEAPDSNGNGHGSLQNGRGHGGALVEANITLDPGHLSDTLTASELFPAADTPTETEAATEDVDAVHNDGANTDGAEETAQTTQAKDEASEEPSNDTKDLSSKNVSKDSYLNLQIDPTVTERANAAARDKYGDRVRTVRILSGDRLDINGSIIDISAPTTRTRDKENRKIILGILLANRGRELLPREIKRHASNARLSTALHIMGDRFVDENGKSIVTIISEHERLNTYRLADDIVVIDERSRPDSATNMAGEDGESVNDNGSQPAAGEGSHETGDETPKEPEPTEVAQERELYEHLRKPVGMSNFLLQIFPAQYGDRILGLQPWQAAILAQGLIERYRVAAITGLRLEKKEMRCSLVEKLTGLYQEPQTVNEISREYKVSAQTVKSNLRNIELFLSKLPRQVLVEMFNYAASAPRPQRTAPATR